MHLTLYKHSLQTAPFCIISVKKAKLNIHNLPNLITNFKHPATDSNDLQ
jgi:hypothetical protein